MTYSNMAQAIYPHPVELNVDKLASTAQEKLEALKQAPSLTAFISSRQWRTMGALPEAARHLSEPLMREYVYKGILVHTGPSWTQSPLEISIPKGSHASSCTPKMTAFYHG